MRHCGNLCFVAKRNGKTCIVVNIKKSSWDQKLHLKKFFCKEIIFILNKVFRLNNILIKNRSSLNHVLISLSLSLFHIIDPTLAFSSTSKPYEPAQIFFLVPVSLYIYRRRENAQRRKLFFVSSNYPKHFKVFNTTLNIWLVTSEEKQISEMSNVPRRQFRSLRKDKKKRSEGKYVNCGEFKQKK